MRPIKFRLWDAENQEMINGDDLAFEEYAPITHLLTREGIMQYTGLKDKNGKEIYEGDVIVNTCGNNFKVVWGKMEWSISNNDNYYIGWVPDQIEVIGSIYTHPELLEATK